MLNVKPEVYDKRHTAPSAVPSKLNAPSHSRLHQAQ